MSRITLLAICLAFASVAIGIAHAETGVEAQYSQQGLTTLKVDGLAITSEAAPAVNRITFTDTYRDKRAEGRAALFMEGPEETPYIDRRTFEDGDTELKGQVFDPAARRLTQTYTWGQIHFDYSTQANRLDVKTTVINRSGRVIEYVDLTLLTLDIPELEAGNRSHRNIGSPTILRANYKGGLVLIANEQMDLPLEIQWDTRRNQREIKLLAGHPGGGVEAFDGGPWNSRPIDKGQTDTYHVSLRFGPARADRTEMAQDIYERFRQAFPQVLNWPDRRPIGSAFIAGYYDRGPQNPRHYFCSGDPEDGDDMDVRTAEGREELIRRLLRYADGLIRTSEAKGAQGVIVWDLEGTEYPHPITYLGEPRLLNLLAPEMDAAADIFFARLTAAGLRHGMTIRPTLLRAYDADGKQVDDWSERTRVTHAPWMMENAYDRHYSHIGVITPEEMQNTIARLDNKIKYANERWGSTMFYVDTPHLYRPRNRNEGHGAWSGRPLAAEVFEELARRNPDVLLIPEYSRIQQYWTSTAPYLQIGYSAWMTPTDVRAIYPEGFAAQFMANEPGVVDNNPEYFINEVTLGDTFIVHGWYGGQLRQVRQVFGAAALKAPYQVLVTEDAIFVNGEELPDVEELSEYLLDEFFDNPPLSRRRVFVRYRLDVHPLQLRKVIDTITAANGIIAWTQPDESNWDTFWSPNNPLEPLTANVRAMVFHEKDSVRVYIGSASDREELASFEIDPAKLRIGISRPDDVHINTISSLTSHERVRPPATVDEVLDREEDDSFDDDFLRVIQFDAEQERRASAAFQFDHTNFRYERGVVTLLVRPMGQRMLLITRR